jgi:hypothetical protein
MRIALALLCFTAVAHADDAKPVTIHVTATATSAMAKYPAWRAIGQVTAERLGWCPEKGDGTGEAITLSFDEPQPLTAIRINAGHVPEWGGPADTWGVPEKIEVKTDRQAVQATLSRDKDENDVVLSGAPTRAVTVKILAVKPGKVPHTCINSIHFVAPETSYWPVYGFDKAAWQQFATFATDLDRALQHCHASALAKSVRFPLAYEHATIVEEDNPDAQPAKKMTFNSVEQLVAQCRKDDDFLHLGLLGEPEADRRGLADELARAFSDEAGTVRIGDWSTHAWWISWVDGAWQLTKVLTSHDTTRGPSARIADTAGYEIAAWTGKLGAERVFTKDAQIVLVQKQGGIVDAAAAGNPLGLVDVKSHKESDVAVTLARDQRSGVLSFTTKVHGAKDLVYRVSELVVVEGDDWKVAGGMWSEPKPNDAVDKAAAAGIEMTHPISTKLMGDDALTNAFFKMQVGPIDATAAARPDLVVFGSGPGERTVGGAKLARPWAAAWANHVPLDASGVLAKMGPTGTTGWVATDIMLEKRDAKKKLFLVPYRLFLVFDRTVDGQWSLLHAHIATVAP